jgi:hypothetical protein
MGNVLNSRQAISDVGDSYYWSSRMTGEERQAFAAAITIYENILH